MKLPKTPLYAVALLSMMSITPSLAFAEDHGSHDMKALLELKSMGSQALTLKKAVEIALKEQPGLVEKARLEYDDAQVTYQIEIANGKEVYSFNIDPASGKMTENHMEISDTLVNYLSLGLLSLGKEEQLQITSHMQTGLSDIEGKILSIEIEVEDNMTFFEVRSLHNDKLYSNLVSGRTGEVVFYQNVHNQDGHRQD